MTLDAAEPIDQIPAEISSSESDEFEIKYLNAADIRLFRPYENDWTVCLTLAEERSWRGVRIARAFPFSNPDQYVGFRDAADKDIGIVVDVSGLDEQSRAIIADELDRRYFTPQVHTVVSVKELYGTVTWEVVTDRGARRFVVRNMRDNVAPIGPNRILLSDTEGNRYEFPDISALGARAYAVLSKVM
jgi:hypothetical protein